MNIRLQVPSEETHVWNVELAAPSHELRHLQETLSQAERLVASRYRSHNHREHYVVAHGALRSILSRYLGQPPQDLCFAHSASGKPSLLGATDTSPIQFNLSHSADQALVAVSAASAVGVDIEMINPETDVLAIAERFFSSTEIAALRLTGKTERLQRFFQLWVCKEAYLKARGDGIVDRLSNVAISLNEPGDAVRLEDSVDPQASTTWHVRLLDSPFGYCCALVSQTKPMHVRQMMWDLH